MMDTEAAARHVYAALAAAMNGDADTAAEHIEAVATDGDINRVYGICCALGHAAHRSLQVLFGDQAPHPERGDMWVLRQLEPELRPDRARSGEDNPAQVFSLRFITAYANGDTATDEALFEAAAYIGGEHLVRCVVQLVADTAGLCNAGHAALGTTPGAAA
ncbi:hypothetical protein [Streptomyces griseofuscus]|uniref:Uncharacterized protein n=1 Tax=Streptomyces griseofuscus TaxID=146922 RepID=A0A7H1Q3H5_9ACTN|nr:hypothetical protein [Streptomyces griseofuscus]QNT94855.1 hypothetical protein HEP81_04582 [Streptomyces griseofuscus]